MPRTERGIGYEKGSETSREAAEHMEGYAGSIRVEVFRLLRANPKGLTDAEIEIQLDGRHQTVSARRRELVQLGRVYDSGTKRRNPSGCKATVWRAVAKGETLPEVELNDIEKVRKLVVRQVKQADWPLLIKLNAVVQEHTRKNDG